METYSPKVSRLQGTTTGDIFLPRVSEILPQISLTISEYKHIPPYVQEYLGSAPDTLGLEKIQKFSIKASLVLSRPFFKPGQAGRKFLKPLPRNSNEDKIIQCFQGDCLGSCLMLLGRLSLSFSINMVA